MSSAVAGSQPLPQTASATYTAKARRRNQPQKITGRINSAMPAGTTLTVQLSAIGNSTSNGAVVLTTTAKDLVGNITNTNNQSGTISYTFTATVAAGVLPLSTRTVTYTITAWP